MAEGFARNSLTGKKSIIDSAGVRADGLNLLAIEVMKEIDIDISNQISKEISSIDFNQFDIIVTVCDDAQKNCPVIPEKTMIHRSVMDPADFVGPMNQKRKIYRKVRHDIQKIVTDILI